MCSCPEKWAAWIFSLIFSSEAFHLSYLVEFCQHVNSRCLLIWDILNGSGDVLQRNDWKYVYNKFQLFKGLSPSYSQLILHLPVFPHGWYFQHQWSCPDREAVQIFFVVVRFALHLFALANFFSFNSLFLLLAGIVIINIDVLKKMQFKRNSTPCTEEWLQLELESRIFESLFQRRPRQAP